MTTFCTHRPDATPTKLIQVNSATQPAASHGVLPAGAPSKRPRYSPPTVPIAAIAAAYMPSASTQPTTNAARRPNASRAYTYFPPACGRRAASSAKTRVPRNASAPPSTQAANVRIGRPSWRATIPGVRKIPDPTMIPTIIASPSAVRSVRLSRVIANQILIKSIKLGTRMPLDLSL